MIQQPEPFPEQQPSLATPESIALFNAGIAWLSLVGFSPTGQPPPPHPLPPDEAPKHPYKTGP
jgi:hypothetical protein